MDSKPDWLPNILSIDGNWTEILEKLYSIFEKDFIFGKPKLDGKFIFWDRTVKDGEKYENGFWHLIEKNYTDSDERLFDPRRAERLTWCAPAIINFKDPMIKYWECKEAKNKINIYLWIENYDYVIIFQKRKHKIGQIAFLLTAFYVDGNSKKKDLRNKFSKRII